MELKGKTLKVYLYLLKHQNAGVREIQRALKFKTPSLVQYHLNKLKDMGLIYEEKGRYYISKEVKPDILKDFVRIGFILVPRLFLFGIFYFIISLYFMLKYLNDSLSLIDNYLLVFLPLLFSLLIILEGYLAYKRLKV
jgi:DNA-binding transcriptional ArsR family regulator